MRIHSDSKTKTDLVLGGGGGVTFVLCQLLPAGYQVENKFSTLAEQHNTHDGSRKQILMPFFKIAVSVTNFTTRFVSWFRDQCRDGQG